jgi:succinate dehydrogenase / fumarate reductase cytochrome b subunit
MSIEQAGSSAPQNPGPRNAVRGPSDRPLSPHLQVWRWHVTMLGSILHRASGVALYVGAAVVVAWLTCLAAGPDCYACFVGIMGSPLGLLLWLGLSAAAFYHLFSGLRHLVWDLGAGLTPRTASAMATWSIVLAVVATAAYWAWLVISGKVHL